MRTYQFSLLLRIIISRNEENLSDTLSVIDKETQGNFMGIASQKHANFFAFATKNVAYTLIKYLWRSASIFIAGIIEIVYLPHFPLIFRNCKPFLHNAYRAE